MSLSRPPLASRMFPKRPTDVEVVRPLSDRLHLRRLEPPISLRLRGTRKKVLGKILQVSVEYESCHSGPRGTVPNDVGAKSGGALGRVRGVLQKSKTVQLVAPRGDRVNASPRGGCEKMNNGRKPIVQPISRFTNLPSLLPVLHTAANALRATPLPPDAVSFGSPVSNLSLGVSEPLCPHRRLLRLWPPLSHYEITGTQ